MKCHECDKDLEDQIAVCYDEETYYCEEHAQKPHRKTGLSCEQEDIITEESINKKRE